MKVNLEATYPAIIELVLRVPFQKLHIAATLIFSQIDAHSCVVSFRFGPGDGPADWPEGIDNVHIGLLIRCGTRHVNDPEIRETSYRHVLLRKDGKRPPEICIHQGPLFAAMAQHLANHRTSDCPVRLDIAFNLAELEIHAP